MKRNLVLFFATSALIISSCSEKKTAPTVTTSESIDQSLFDWDQNNAPLTMVASDDMNYHIWDSQEDSVMTLSVASKYKTIWFSGHRGEIEFQAAQEGQAGFGTIVYPGRYLHGLRYFSKNGEMENGFAFTEEFLNNHEIIQFKAGNIYDEPKQAPKQLFELLSQKYNDKVRSSVECAKSDDGKVAQGRRIL